MLETEMLCYVPTYRNVATLGVISVRTGSSGTGTSTNMTHLCRSITQDSTNIGKFRLRVSVEDALFVMVAKCQ